MPFSIPLGWDDWRGHTRDHLGEDYWLNEYRAQTGCGAFEADHSTDVFKNRAVYVIRRIQRPFVMYVACNAAHEDFAGPAKIARHHASDRNNLDPTTPPNFNEVGMTDQPAGLSTKSARPLQHGCRRRAGLKSPR